MNFLLQCLVGTIRSNLVNFIEGNKFVKNPLDGIKKDASTVTISKHIT